MKLLIRGASGLLGTKLGELTTRYNCEVFSATVGIDLFTEHPSNSTSQTKTLSKRYSGK